MSIEDQFIRTFSKFFRANEDKRILALYGGAGSGKSYSTAQWIITKWLTGENVRILCTRKTLPSLKITSWSLIKDILSKWNIAHDENRSDLVLSFRNNEMLFKSLDDPEKVKSFEANYIWIEEATELSKEDFLQLDLRTRRLGGCQLILTFNPIDAFHWTITDLVQRPSDNVAVHHSTYKDNRFLPADYVRTLETLNERDANYYRIYTLGEPGVLENIIYTGYGVEDRDTWPDRVAHGPPTTLGVDFGFNNPTAIVSCTVSDQEQYARQLLYRSGMTNRQLIEFLEATFTAHGWSKSIPLRCDSAEPQRMVELCNAGFNAQPANKSVSFGIDHIKARRLHIDAESVDLIKELRGYSYKKDRNGRVLDDPVDAFDHAMDAMRYGFTPDMKDIKPNASRLEKLMIR